MKVAINILIVAPAIRTIKGAQKDTFAAGKRISRDRVFELEKTASFVGRENFAKSRTGDDRKRDLLGDVGSLGWSSCRVRKPTEANLSAEQSRDHSVESVINKSQEYEHGGGGFHMVLNKQIAGIYDIHAVEQTPSVGAIAFD